MAPDVAERYQRAADLLEDLLGRATARPPRRTRATVRRRDAARRSRPRLAQQAALARKPRRRAPQPRFCWQCHKPLHARTDRCPFCGEAQ